MATIAQMKAQMAAMMKTAQSMKKRAAALPKTKPAPKPVSKPAPADKKDDILNWVSGQKGVYGTSGFGFDNREQMIEQGVATYGEENRQFIVDTIYRELRDEEGGEPAYKPPDYDVYKGKKPAIKSEPVVEPIKPEPLAPLEEPPEEPTEPVDIIPDVVDETGELVIPQELLDDPYFMQLDDDMKAMAIYSWNIEQAAKTASEEEIKAYQDAFLEAITEAEKQADPYWSEKLSIIKTEFQRGIGILSEDLASVEKDISTRKARIEEDLKYNREQLTIEQQAELSRQKKSYDYQLKGVREKMASRGLSFSTIRSEAEEKTKETHEDIVESSARQYKRQLRALETGTQRGVEDLASQLETAKRKTEEAKTSATRGVETQIGSQLLDIPETEQYEQGGIYGAPWKTAKQSDIFQRALEQMQISYPNL